MKVWKIIFLSKWVICRFHVNLPGGIGIGLVFICIMFVMYCQYVYCM